MASWQNASFQYGKQKKWQVGKMACWQNDVGKMMLAKWQVGKMTSCQNGMLAKWHVGKWQVGKWQVGKW